MNSTLEEDQTEEYYRKLLLSDKVKAALTLGDLVYIFNQGYCWKILFNDKYAPLLCLSYALFHNKRFPEGEKIIAKDGFYAYRYAREILNSRFPEGEPAILQSLWKDSYIYFLEYNSDFDGYIECQNMKF